MDLTNDELAALYECVSDEVYYGDDEVVYGHGDYAVSLRSALLKINAEAARRKIW